MGGRSTACSLALADAHQNGGFSPVSGQPVTSFTAAPLWAPRPLVLRHTVKLSCEVLVPHTHSVLKYCSPFDSILGFKLVLSKNQFLLPLG